MRPLVLLAAILLPLPAFSQTQDDSVSTRIDWTSGTLHVTVERPVESTGPAAISRTQRSIRNDAPRLILPVLIGMPIDSRHDVRSLSLEREELITALERAAGRATPVEAGSTADLRTARVTFVLDIYRDLGSEFIVHERPIPIGHEPGWIAHADYTGILIYAADELPLFGTGESARIEPTLFPGIYYTSGSEDLIFRLSEAEYVDPAQLASHGPAAYTDDVQATGLGDRLGPRPLRILAIGAFGSRPTDIVISEADARQIMASEANRSLLRHGRVVIVVDSDRL